MRTNIQPTKDKDALYESFHFAIAWIHCKKISVEKNRGRIQAEFIAQRKRPRWIFAQEIGFPGSMKRMIKLFRILVQ